MNSHLRMLLPILLLGATISNAHLGDVVYPIYELACHEARRLSEPPRCSRYHGVVPTMTSDEQVKSNRRNAERSSGPITDAGKKVSRFNAVKHGLTGQTVVLPDEDPQAFAELRERLRGEHRPCGELERQLVDRIAEYLCPLRGSPDSSED